MKTVYRCVYILFCVFCVLTILSALLGLCFGMQERLRRQDIELRNSQTLDIDYAIEHTVGADQLILQQIKILQDDIAELKKMHVKGF